MRVVASTSRDSLAVTITDDGRGVELAEIRARAIELGVIEPGVVDITARWLDLVCSPGFTTRRAANDVSGRGVGLDSVRSGVLEVGGNLRADSVRGAGTTWVISIPLPRMTVESHLLRVPGLPFPIAIDTSWVLAPIDAPLPELPLHDVAFRLGVTDEPTTAQVRYFTRGDEIIGFAVDREPVAATVRAVVAPPAPSPFAVVLLDTVEGLLVHPERLGVAHTRATRSRDTKYSSPPTFES